MPSSLGLTVSLLAVVLTAGTAAVAQDVRLVEAAEQQDREAVSALTAQAFDVNVEQPDGATALHWAAHWNDLQTATLLIRADADANATNELGVPPLWLAALNASPAMASVLLDAGADPNATLPSGETVLMTGARTGSAELVRALVTAGAALNARTHWRNQTALMWAAAEGHAEVVRVLLESGADVGARSKHGGTALLLAARNGDVETARSLLDAGADVNAAEPVLATDARVDVDESQTSGRSPLLVASASVVATSGFEYRLVVKPSHHETLAIFLLEHGADPNLPDSIGRTPLHAAAETGKPELVKVLLSFGADPNARLIQAPPPLRGDFVSYARYSGATPLWLAAAARVPDPDIVRALAAAGADADLAADDGTTPLMAAVGMVQNEARLAAESEALAIVELLVELDIEVNALDRRGRTAMHGAARLARNSLIPVLVEHGAKVDIADAKGKTPMDVGTVSRPLHPDTASLLRRLAGTAGPFRTEGPNDHLAPRNDEQKVTQDLAVTSVWDGAYTETQAKRGEATYLESCARCHRDDLKGEELAPSLVGVAFTFRWRDQGVSDLFTSLRSSMPSESPGSLSDQAYVDVVAFLLSANHYPAGDEELRPDVTALAEIEIEAKRP